MTVEYTELVYLEAGDFVTATLNWNDSSDFDFLLIHAGDPYDFDSCIFNAAAATGSKPEHFEGYIPSDGWYELVVEWFEGPGTDVEFDMFFAVLYDEIYTNTVAAGELMEVDISTLSANDGVYLVTTTSAGWNFDHTINTRFAFDGSAPVITTDSGDYIIEIGDSVDLLWNFTDYTEGTYEILVDSVNAVGGVFTGEGQATYTYVSTTNGTFEIEIIVTDMFGAVATDLLTITVNPEATTDPTTTDPTTTDPTTTDPTEDEPFIAGYGFMSLAAFSAVALLALRKKFRK